MASGSQFALISTATAIALVLPSAQSTDVNTIRSVHDRAYRKWPPHINVLYPSVTPDELQGVLPLFRKALDEASLRPPQIQFDQIGKFSHRKNATVFLQPSEESEYAISQLRGVLVKALGLSDQAGTFDGSYKPHLTLGQASLIGPSVDRFMKKVSPLTGIRWEAVELAVMRRKITGEMEIIDHIQLDPLSTAIASNLDVSNNVSMSSHSVWSSCFSFHPRAGWLPYRSSRTDTVSDHRTVSILSYNLLADSFGCSFAKRLPLIIEAITHASKANSEEVLCFQEVSNGMIVDLLSHSFIQQRYNFCSHSPSSILANYLNLVTLSTIPFEYTFHHFEERHKSALVMRPHQMQLEIANLHLTAALKDNMVAAKQRQIVSLTAFLEDSTKGTPRTPVIAGDFNIATSPATIQAAFQRGDISFVTSIAARTMIDPDTWDDAYLLSRAEVDLVNEEDGATFDVQKNPLAAESNAPADQKPQRYDRILFRKHCPVYVETFQLFGLPNAQGECGSDHFGINAVLRIGNNRTTSKLQISSCSSYQISFVQDETDLRPLLIPSLPSQQDRNRRETAITRLTKLLTSDSRLSDVLAAPLGSYAMDTYFSDSDVDVLIIGSLAPTAFFNIATARLKTIGECFQGLHYINSLVPVIEVELLGIKFDVQYCQAPQLTSPKAVEARSIEEFVFDKDLIAELPPPALRPLNTYRDAAYLLRSIPCLEAFRTAHRFLSLYLRRRGLYSAKFGYLGGVHLSLMLNHVIKHLDSSISIEMNAASLVRTFATYYAQFSWESEVVRDPSYSRHDYRRTSREPVVILAIHSPTARPNVASSCSKLSVQTLTREFGLARDKLAKGDWEWILREQGSTFQDFTARFGAFLVVSIDMWNLPKLGDGPQRGFLGSVESRMPLLMVNLGRIEGLYGQAWPFSLSSQQDEVEVGKQSKAYYVVGVSAPVNADAVARKAVQNKVIQVAHNFETVTKSSDHYDEKCMLIQLEMASRKKLLGMILEVQ